MLSLRPFVPADYPALAQIYNACYPLMTPTSGALRRVVDDRLDRKKYAFERAVACWNERVIGVASVFEPWYFYAPGRWHVELMVHPEHRRRGVGRALWGHVQTYLSHRPATLLFADAYESDVGLAWAQRRGFEIKVREIATKLELSTFDAQKFEGLEARLATEGVRVLCATEALATVPDVMRKWWDLQWAIHQDIPFNRPFDRMPFDAFLRYFNEPNHHNELWFLGVAGEALVGVSGVKPSTDPKQMFTAITGVVRAHRREGLATALKRRTIDAAVAFGAAVIKTENEENNPMLALNLKLGFKQIDVWANLECDLISS